MFRYIFFQAEDGIRDLIVTGVHVCSSDLKNPTYIYDLLLSVINLSVQTVDIVNSLPKLKF